MEPRRRSSSTTSSFPAASVVLGGSELSSQPLFQASEGIQKHFLAAADGFILSSVLFFVSSFLAKLRCLRTTVTPRPRGSAGSKRTVLTGTHVLSLRGNRYMLTAFLLRCVCPFMFPTPKRV